MYKKQTKTLMGMILLGTMMSSFQASALTYKMDAPKQPDFGKPTSIEVSTEVPVRESKNINRSKDSAFIPPTFASPSADTRGTGTPLTPNISGVAPMQIGSTGELVENTSGMIYSAVSNAGGTLTPEMPPAVSPVNPPVSAQPAPTPSAGFTPASAVKQKDGSIGRLKIPSLGVNIKVYDGESLSNMRKGAGHFSSTSCWDGNVAMAAHNRGTNSYFGEIHKLRNGDTITYETSLGKRTYVVDSVRQIKETDMSCLDASVTNKITLVTCVRNVRENRWCVQATEA